MKIMLMRTICIGFVLQILLITPSLATLQPRLTTVELCCTTGNSGKTISSIFGIRGGAKRLEKAKDAKVEIAVSKQKLSAPDRASGSNKGVVVSNPFNNASINLTSLVGSVGVVLAVIISLFLRETIQAHISFPNASDNSFRMFLLVMMVIQNSCVVLVGRHTRSNTKSSDLYVINHLVLTCEAMKFIFSCILEYIHTDGKLLSSMKTHIFKEPMNSVKIIIPSLLYLLQNSLMYVALSNLSAPLFQVTYQGKLLTTALASVLMLERQYSPQQWVCLTALGVGVAVVVLGEKIQQQKAKITQKKKNNIVGGHDMPRQHLMVGLFAVTVSCLSSALASVYLEKVLKKPGDTKSSSAVSLWMWNIQMAFFSACIALLKEIHLASDDTKKRFLHGFTPWVWLQVLLQAGGGMLVAAIMKYADNVLKGLATGVSVVISTALSHLFFGTVLTSHFSFGAVIIMASVYFFSH